LRAFMNLRLHDSLGRSRYFAAKEAWPRAGAVRRIGWRGSAETLT
jgi:hypothetical protein